MLRTLIGGYIVNLAFPFQITSDTAVAVEEWICSVGIDFEITKRGVSYEYAT